MFNRTITLLAIALLTVGMTAGCDKKSDSGASSDESKAQAESAEKTEQNKEKADDKKAAAEQKEEKKADKEEAAGVDVPKDGKKFKPSVKAAQLPEGAWHCDMKGKAHYAAMQKPEEGKCPVCNMKLVQAGAGSGHGDKGHGHGEGEHTHN